MIDALQDLSRDKGARNLNGVLTEVGGTVDLEGTAARCRCHFVASDGNDRIKVDALAEKVSRQALEYCTPRSRLLEADAEFEKTNSREAIIRLQEEARELFTKIDSSGEAGEMLLYLLLEVGLGLPQIFCKMPLKTNPQMHVHGVDGVHGSLGPDGRLGLYWCEAKLYASVSAATRECFASLGPYLLDDGSGPAQRDLLLVRDGLDTGNEDLNKALRAFLDDDSSASGFRVVKGACLIGFSLEDYPSPFAEDGVSLVEEVKDQLKGWFAGAGNRVLKEGIETFEIEIFCVPMPDVEAFRAAVKRHLRL
ncbi:MAG TPA: DUF1837 domain-containing protein [Terrimicrobiaceae bacterium]|nr:DUF1837 domain-containing protein [Terrimicrobiaceae bacterium]